MPAPAKPVASRALQKDGRHRRKCAAMTSMANYKLAYGRTREFSVRRLRLEDGIPVEIIHPAFVQIIRRKQPPVLMQIVHGRLVRHARRPHMRLARPAIALPKIAAGT